MKYAVMAVLAIALFATDIFAAPVRRVVVGRQRAQVVVGRRAVVVQQRRAVVVPVRRAVVVRQVVVGRRAAVVVQRRAIVVRRGVQFRRLRGQLNVYPQQFRAPVVQLAQAHYVAPQVEQVEVEEPVVQKVIVQRQVQKVVVQQIEQDDCYGHCQTAAIRVARIVNGYRYAR